MKAIKVTFYMVDFDELGKKGVVETLTNTRFPNDCMNPSIIDVCEADIGEWSDSHPLNSSATSKNEILSYFEATK